MNSKKKTLSMLLTLAALSLIATGCATAPPPELVAARSAYKHASLARAEAPAELHKAKSSLDVAEAAFSDKPEAQSTRDLAYVAQRKAQLATAIARTRLAERQQQLAEEAYRAQQAKSAQKTTDALAATRGDLAATERSRQASVKALAGERVGRQEAEARAAAYEKRAKDAMDALAKLAAVKKEARGLVITLSGSVLFASNKSQLLTSARMRLNQVSKALLETKDRTLTVEGHTDSQGSDGYNLRLSKRRANAVRAYLISRGYPAAKIKADGLGEGRPLADNGTVEGRANNRRVEIVVAPRAKSASL